MATMIRTNLRDSLQPANQAAQGHPETTSATAAVMSTSPRRRRLLGVGVVVKVQLLFYPSFITDLRPTLHARSKSRRVATAAPEKIDKFLINYFLQG